MHKTIQTANRVLRLPTLAFVACVAAAVTLAASGPAHAKAHGKSHGAAPKVGLMTFTGPGEAASRNAVEKALKSRKIVVLPASELTAAAKSAHVKLDSNDGFKAVAKALDLTAIVTGEVSKKKATITVHTGEDGSVVGEETFQGADPKKVAATVGKTFWKRLAGPFNKTKHPSGGSFEAPPPEEEPASAGGAEASDESKKTDEAPPAESRREKKTAKSEKTEETTETKTEEKSEKSEKTSSKTAEESEPTAGSSEAVDVFLGPAWFMRSLSFNQARNDLSNTKVASYSLPRAPTLSLRADIFPGALAGMDGFAANVGLTLDVSYLLPVVKSKGADGDYNTTALAYDLGVKVRLPFGTFASVSYGDQSFKLTKSNSNMPDAVVPGTNYKFVRVGLGIRNQVTSTLMLQANLGYLQCLGKPGDIGGSNFFPRATCNGFEAGVGAGYRLAPQWEIRAGVDWRRFGLNFHVKSSDVTDDPSTTPPIAGGAVDQYIQIYAGIAYLFGGSGSTAHAAEPASSNEGAKPAKAAKSDEGGEDSE